MILLLLSILLFIPQDVYSSTSYIPSKNEEDYHFYHPVRPVVNPQRLYGYGHYPPPALGYGRFRGPAPVPSGIGNPSYGRPSKSHRYHPRLGRWLGRIIDLWGHGQMEDWLSRLLGGSRGPSRRPIRFVPRPPPFMPSRIIPTPAAPPRFTPSRRYPTPAAPPIFTPSRRYPTLRPPPRRSGSKDVDVVNSRDIGVHKSNIVDVTGSHGIRVAGSDRARVDNSKLVGVHRSRETAVGGSHNIGVHGSHRVNVRGSRKAGIRGSQNIGVDGSHKVDIVGSGKAGVRGS